MSYIKPVKRKTPYIPVERVGGTSYQASREREEPYGTAKTEAEFVAEFV